MPTDPESHDPAPFARILAQAEANRKKARAIRERLQLEAFRSWRMNFVNRTWAEAQGQRPPRGPGKK